MIVTDMAETAAGPASTDIVVIMLIGPKGYKEIGIVDISIML
jgi:hypothetical protein